jgi:hypothetical protein
MSDQPVSRDAERIRAVLSHHGHGFQFAVINELLHLALDRRIDSQVEAVEFPFEVKGQPGHADILLRNEHAVAVVECKKVRTGLSTWGFARSNLVSRSDFGAQTVALEGVTRLNPDPKLNACLRPGRTTDRQYNVFAEMKDGKGNKEGMSRGALDNAVTQALRSSSGVLRQLIGYPSLIPGSRGATLVIVPVIVTNARLLACNTDLAFTDLTSGRLPENLHVQERDWLWLRTMASAGVRHEFWHVGGQASSSFGDFQDQRYARSIAVTTPAGLADCLAGISTHVTVSQ